MINISNPANPTFVSGYDWSFSGKGTTQEVFVSGNYAYCADGSAGLKIVNISNPASLSLAGEYESQTAYGVFVSGTFAYVADGTSSGLKIINVSNPGNPTLAGSYTTPGGAYDVVVSGNYAYVADWGFGLQIVDVSNPASPSLAGSYNSSGTAWGVCVVGEFAYVADQSTLLILRFNGAVDVDDSDDQLPYQFSLSQNTPNPFNPVTTIEFSIPQRSIVTVEIFNALGQKVRTLVNEPKAAGSYRIEWNGQNDTGLPVATGVYVYRIQAGDFSQTKKMVLVR